MPRATNVYATTIEYTVERLNDNGAIKVEMVE